MCGQMFTMLCAACVRAWLRARARACVRECVHGCVLMCVSAWQCGCERLCALAALRRIAWLVGVHRRRRRRRCRYHMRA